MAKAFLDAVGASSGPLYASAFRAAGAAVADRLNLDAGAMTAWLEGISAGIRSRGGCRGGRQDDDRRPGSGGLGGARRLCGGEELAAVLAAARDGAEAGRDHTAEIESRRGRSKKLGARSIGHVDPGAASAHIILAALAEAAPHPIVAGPA